VWTGWWPHCSSGANRPQTKKQADQPVHKTGSYGSTALGFFVKRWKRGTGQNGRMAFCNVSDAEKEVLGITRLDRLWPVCPSRAEALEAVKE
jgi:hypothetical protein